MSDRPPTTISWEDFTRVDLRVGRVIRASAFPEARKPAYRIRVDFGAEVGVLETSAQVTSLYAQDDLVGRQVVGVVNLPPKRIGPFESEFLLVGAYREDGAVVLIGPDSEAPLGARLA